MPVFYRCKLILKSGLVSKLNKLTELVGAGLQSHGAGWKRSLNQLNSEAGTEYRSQLRQEVGDVNKIRNGQESIFFALNRSRSGQQSNHTYFQFFKKQNRSRSL